MAVINRSSIIQKAVNDLGILTSNDKVPSETLDKVQLTYDLNKTSTDFVSTNGQTATGAFTVTMPTIDSRSDIYITSVTLSYVKDATNDIATGDLAVTGTPAYSGVAAAIANLAVLTLTAQYDAIVITFPYPMKMKPNTNLSINGTFTAGSMRRNASVTGFITSTN